MDPNPGFHARSYFGPLILAPGARKFVCFNGAEIARIIQRVEVKNLYFLNNSCYLCAIKTHEFTCPQDQNERSKIRPGVESRTGVPDCQTWKMSKWHDSVRLPRERPRWRPNPEPRLNSDGTLEPVPARGITMAESPLSPRAPLYMVYLMFSAPAVPGNKVDTHAKRLRLRE